MSDDQKSEKLEQMLRERQETTPVRRDSYSATSLSITRAPRALPVKTLEEVKEERATRTRHAEEASRYLRDHKDPITLENMEAALPPDIAGRILNLALDDEQLIDVLDYTRNFSTSKITSALWREAKSRSERGELKRIPPIAVILDPDAEEKRSFLELMTRASAPDLIRHAARDVGSDEKAILRRAVEISERAANFDCVENSAIAIGWGCCCFWFMSSCCQGSLCAITSGWLSCIIYCACEQVGLRSPSATVNSVTSELQNLERWQSVDRQLLVAAPERKVMAEKDINENGPEIMHSHHANQGQFVLPLDQEDAEESNNHDSDDDEEPGEDVPLLQRGRW